MSTMMMTLSQVHAMLPGSELIHTSQELAQTIPISRVGSDSRQVEPEELFITLSGDRFDAHQFLAEVAKAQASAALVSNPAECPNDLPAVCVQDTKLGLGQLAKAWRAQFSIPVAIVTGSNGKTTVKEMIAAIFKMAVGETATLVTQGNLNNDIGLPLTLLRMRMSDRLAVIELGMNHPGETAELAAIALPNIVLINNAQREHQEFMGTVEAVAHEHASALRALPENGVAVFPADSEFASFWKEVATGRAVIDFALLQVGSSLGEKAAVTGKKMNDGSLAIQTKQGNITVKLNTIGDHHARNALAATAVALGAGLSLQDIQQGLESFLPVNGRMQSKPFTTQCTLIDDTYNANPDSVRAAIDALKQSGDIAWLVLGDMGEVGDQGPAFHQEVGAYAAEQGISKVFLLGDQCRFVAQGFNEAAKEHQKTSRAMHCNDINHLIAELNDALASQNALDRTHVTILVKGSRFMRMERVVQTLLEEVKTCS